MYHTSHSVGNESPTVHDLHSDSHVRFIGFADSAEVHQQQAEALWAALCMEDSKHCRDCGQITSGSVIAGSPVQLCDRCLAEWAVHQLGAEIIRDVLSVAV